MKTLFKIGLFSLISFFFAASSAYLNAQTTNETVYTGTKVQFSATADGTTPINFTWYKNGSLLIPDGTIVTVTSSASQSSYTNDILTFNGIRTSDAGTYIVTAKNVAGSADSSPVAMLVIVGVGPNNVKIFFKRL